ncbi:MAG TPA: ChaB family protein [Solirubrobacteraceae bacterium]|nr:ChaB family protein [Solirubrobacteraceae bacterium]
MPVRKEDLPSTLKRSPGKVQRTFAKTLESAEETYDEDERAVRTAWSAVKQVAEKKGDRWQLKDEPGASDSGFADAAGGVDTTKSKRELLEDAREADIPGRSKMDKGELIEALQRHNERETARARG